MKKGLIKLIVFLITFVVALLVGNKIMNKDHDNLTMEMPAASLPLVTMVSEGIEYNQLHGYTVNMDVALMRDTITVLGKEREVDFVVNTFGENVTDIRMEVRDVTGERLIENTQITDVRTLGQRIMGNIRLKDLIEKDEKYSLAVVLELNGEREVYYYTQVIWSDELYVTEKLNYVIDFHQKIYDPEAAKSLTKYLETNSALEDNASFHKVNIHSSFRQITWDGLGVTQVGEPLIRLSEIASQTASVLIDYNLFTMADGNITYYTVQEFFRIRYTSDRMYLLNYERTMTQIPDTGHMYANDKLLLGITETEVPMMESADGNTVVFEMANQLLCYNVTSNKLTAIFRFYDKDNADSRSTYNQHAIRILDVDESGSVLFAVYGYLNRGKHEGEVGIQLYAYSSTRNTIEELLYIPYDKTYSVLAAEMERLLYLNREQKLFLMLNGAVHCVDLTELTCTRIIDTVQDGSLLVSENHKIAVWSEESDIYQSKAIHIRNFSDDTGNIVKAAQDEVIIPLDFMGEDIIYGVAYVDDVVEEATGRIFFPMYKICICDASGKLLKEYKQNNTFVIECTVEDNQITLERLSRLEDGSYVEILQDHIMNNVEAKVGDNVVVSADIERYKRYVQIKVKKEIDSKSIMILTPKEVMYEGERELVIDGDEDEHYYVYGAYGVEGIFHTPSEAVKLAYENAGVVIDEKGAQVWMKGNRVNKNQIMAIKEPEHSESGKSLGVCLDTILKFEGLVRNTEYMLEQGQTALEIMQENMTEAKILDLTGCNLDAMLYYVNRDIPVLAQLADGEAVLVTGFNDSQVVIMEPSTGKLYKKGMKDSAAWFEENGNCFIAYMEK